MLKFVVNACPNIEDLCTEGYLLTDKELYDVFQGYLLIESLAFDANHLGALVNALMESGSEPGDDLVVHTFNPLIINFLDKDAAIEVVHFYDPETKSLRPLFKDMPGCLEKLDSMGPGEVVARTILPQWNEC